MARKCMDVKAFDEFKKTCFEQSIFFQKLSLSTHSVIHFFSVTVAYRAKDDSEFNGYKKLGTF